VTFQGPLSWLRDNTDNLGTSATAGRPRDLFVARDLHVTGFFHVQGTLVAGVHIVTIASNGVGGVANSETLSGLRPIYGLDCLDGDGCSISLATSDIAAGTFVRLVNLSTSGSANHNITLSDTAPLHLAGGLTLTADDTATFLFMRNRSGAGAWYEIGRSAN